jgi:glycosyltransferase involved in cell wall biosynthesis
VDWFRTQGIDASKLTVIPPAVITPEPLDATQTRRDLGIAPNDVVLFAAGSMHQPRVLTDAVWTYEIMRYTSNEIHLLVCGDGPERPAIHQFAHQLAPEGTRVHFLGVRADVPQLLTAVDVALVTASNGGLNYVLEAFAAGCCVVAHRTPQIASVLQHETNGLLVERGDHPAAAKALQRLITDAALQQRLRTGALTTAAHYTIERACTAWQAVYSSS